MTQDRFRQARHRVYRGTLAGFVFACAACGSPDPPRDPGARAAAPRYGVRAYVDRDTGELGTPPDGYDQAHLGGGSAGDALEVVPGRTTAGGVMVDLRGRFSYDLRAAVADDGRLTAHCDARSDTPGD